MVQWQRRLDKTAKMIGRDSPDVVLMQEVRQDFHRKNQAEQAKARHADAEFVRKGRLCIDEVHKVFLAPEENALHGWAWMMLEGEMTRVALLPPSIYAPTEVVRVEVRISYINKNYIVTHVTSVPSPVL